MLLKEAKEKACGYRVHHQGPNDTQGYERDCKWKQEVMRARSWADFSISLPATHPMASLALETATTIKTKREKAEKSASECAEFLIFEMIHDPEAEKICKSLGMPQCSEIVLEGNKCMTCGTEFPSSMLTSE
jgi:hypothetical protein